MLNTISQIKNPQLAKNLVQEITKLALQLPQVKIMEVCGTHTVSIFKSGIRSLLPENVKLVSGPGCPVCVTPNNYIDQSIWLALEKGVILTSFGDMLKVPGSKYSLAQAKSLGADIRVVYSTLDALKIAEENPEREVVFLGIGFETTTPTVASAVLLAAEQGLNNFSIIGSHKTIPAALRALAENKEIGIDAFLLPGHVSAIIGLEPYVFIANEYNLPGVIAGFESVDILMGIYEILQMLIKGQAQILNAYPRIVKTEGNPVAREIVNRIFQPADAYWRGIGLIPETGLELKDQYKTFDAKEKFNIPDFSAHEPKGCRCGEVLRGLVTPPECPLFSRKCTPETPVGACMVSIEGTCAAYYRYGV